MNTKAAEEPFSCLVLVQRTSIQAWTLEARPGYGATFPPDEQLLQSVFAEAGYERPVELVGVRKEPTGDVLYLRFPHGSPSKAVEERFLARMLSVATTWKAVPVPVELIELLSRGALYLVHHDGVSTYYPEEEVLCLMSLPVTEATLGEMVLEVHGATLRPRRLTPAERNAFLQLRRQTVPVS